jgi:serine/threonine protein kinase
LHCPTCGTASSDTPVFCAECGEFLAGVGPGAVIAARYEILRALGRGGMGMVFAAHDRKLDERVALKLLRPSPGASEDMVRRFRSEVTLARRIRHDNVCAIHDYGEDGALQFISMELVEGQDLKTLIRGRGALPRQEAFDVAIQVAEGLVAIHAKGIVHRDLKPTNIMLDSRGVVRLMDFGIARRLTAEGTSVTTLGQVVGTPEYMSPEQARGEKVDLRSDIYALGVVVFEMFTGRVPFRGDTPVATILKHLQEPPPLQEPGAAPIPGPVVEVLRRALAKPREERYARTEDLVLALRHACADSLPGVWSAAVEGATQTIRGTKLAPGVTAPCQAVSHAPRRARRRLAWVLGVPAGSLLLAGAYLVGHYTLKPTPAPSPSVEVPSPAPTARSTLPEESPSPAATHVAPSVRAPQADSPSLPETPSATLAATPAPTPSPSPPATPAPTPKPASESRPPSPRNDLVAPSSGSRPADEAAPEPPPSPSAVEAAPPLDAATGHLRIVVAPWATVVVDDKEVGTTPFDEPLELPVGRHVVRLVHPDYYPLRREVTVAAGETTELRLDLAWEGFKR